MKVLLVNGSPHEKGCTDTALCEAAAAMEQEGIETAFYWIGNKPIGGCIGCYRCGKRQKYGMVPEAPGGGRAGRCAPARAGTCAGQHELYPVIRTSGRASRDIHAGPRGGTHPVGGAEEPRRMKRQWHKGFQSAGKAAQSSAAGGIKSNLIGY